ncbi:TRAP transporter small permease subunit, partial [bacterium]|nr:TRAP transporter small permease subunit [bacterium]
MEHLLTVTFMAITLLVTLLVTLRYVFDTTIVGGNEISVMLFVWTTALGAAVELAHGKHIIVDVFVNYLPPAIRHWLDIINLFIIGVLNIYLLKYGIDWINTVGGSEHP